jgi:diacylglycerol kinase (ATP)
VALVTIDRVLLIVNPAARRGKGSQAAVSRAFDRAGVVCDVVHTEHAGHAGTLAAALAPSYDAIFTLGGDGTVMDVAGALIGSQTPIGILPGGTGNLIARALGIPMSAGPATRALATGEVRGFDLGRLHDGRVFAFAAGMGIDAAMIEGTSTRAKRLLGVAAYMVPATRAVLRVDRFALRAVVDGESLEFEATLAMVANFGSVLHGLLRLGPFVAADDGRLDLCVFCPATVGDALRVAWRIARGDFRPDPAMQFVQGRHIRLETHPPRMSQADGELLGVAALEATVMPLAARFLVPRRPSPA